MTGPDANRALVGDWYRALRESNLERFAAVHAPDCIYNISGHTPISGRVGFPQLLREVLPQVFPRLQMETFRFATRWTIVCQDAHRIVGMMEAEGLGTNGVRYDQRYLHIFQFAEGRIAEVWEFFDTALANTVLFADAGPASTPEPLPAFGFPAADEDIAKALR